MKQKIEIASVEKMFSRASFMPETFNSTDLTIELTWTTGAQVKRFSYRLGDFTEELSVDESSIRLERLNLGAPVLNNHNNTELADQIGVVEKAWLENGVGKALVRFSQREDVAPIIKDVSTGIVRNVSVGYIVHKYQDVSVDENGPKILRAIDWEPMELSLVTIPADASAQIRSEKENKNKCEIISRKNIKEESSTMDPIEIQKAKDEAVKAERLRATEIRSAVVKAGLDSEFAEQMIDQGVSIDEARKQVIDKMAAASAATRIAPQVSVSDSNEKIETMVRGMEQALEARLDSRIKVEKEGRDFQGMSILRMGEELLRAKGESVRYLSKNELYTRVMMSTSDFPNILGNLANKRLRKAYDEYPKTFMPLVREVEVADFKNITTTALGEAPDLEKVLQDGEIKRDKVSETAEVYKVETYAKIIPISRQAIINDNMSAFQQMPQRFGIAAARLLGDLVWGIVNGGHTATYAMSDGNPIFHAAHSNTASGSTVLDNTTLGLLVQQLRKQTGINGKKLGLNPGYLVVSPGREVAAKQLLTLVQAAQASGVNVFANTIKGLIIESRLTDTANPPWFLTGSVDEIDLVEIAYLQGQRGLYTEQRVGFDVDGIEIKARLDVGAKCVDWRGFQRHAGS